MCVFFFLQIYHRVRFEKIVLQKISPFRPGYLRKFQKKSSMFTKSQIFIEYKSLRIRKNNHDFAFDRSTRPNVNENWKKVQLTSIWLFKVHVITTLWFFFPSACLTPLDDKGVCINIERCPLLQSLFDNKRNNESVSSFLKKSFCGHENSYPKVCCPLDEADAFIRTLEHDVSGKPTIDVGTPVDSVVSSEYNKTAVPPAKLPPSNECGRSNVTVSRIKNGLHVKLGNTTILKSWYFRFCTQPASYCFYHMVCAFFFPVYRQLIY